MWLEVGHFEMAGRGEEFSGDAGGGRSAGATEKRVAGDGEVEFVDEIELGEFVDEAAAAFAVEGFDAVIGGEDFEKLSQRRLVDNDGRRSGWFLIAGDEEMDGAAGFLENRVVRVDFSGS